jgi:transposase-like protein
VLDPPLLHRRSDRLIQPGAFDDEHDAWQKRDLSTKRYAYVWADGIHLQARLEDEKQCILVLIGATPEGRKELVGLIDGSLESAQDWRDLLLDLKRRGLDVWLSRGRDRPG